jgi:pimeloyl-ACP methyl ester carboxylesterase
MTEPTTTIALDPIAIPEHLEHRVRTPDGRTVAVAEWGDPNGLPLIAFHGTPGGRIGWWEDPTIYARHGLRRLTFDRPGYGESTRLPGRSVADVVPDVVTIADAAATPSPARPCCPAASVAARQSCRSRRMTRTISIGSPG